MGPLFRQFEHAAISVSIEISTAPLGARSGAASPTPGVRTLGHLLNAVNKIDGSCSPMRTAYAGIPLLGASISFSAHHRQTWRNLRTDTWKTVDTWKIVDTPSANGHGETL